MRSKSGCRTLAATASCGVLLAASLVVSGARAEGPSRETGFDARSFRPSVDPRAGTSYEPAGVPTEGRLAFGAFIGASKNPLSLDGRAVVSTRRLFDLTLAAVLTPRLLLGVDLPFVVQESRPLSPAVAGVSRSAGAGLGDLAVQGKAALLTNETGGFGLALLPRLSLPTGDPATFVSERGVSASAVLLADYNFLLAGVQASAGLKLRTTRADLEPGVRYGNEVPFHLAIWLRPSLFKLDPAERNRWEIGVHGSVPAGPAGPFGTGAPGSSLLSPVTLRIGNRLQIGKKRDVNAIFGFEVGLHGAAAPAYGLFLGFTFHPRAHDRDHDGVEDEKDLCPDVPDRAQGAGGRDGCPKVEAVKDRDHDRIPDADDACPDEAGDATDDLRCHGCAIGDRDHDGVDDHDDRCPDERGVPPDGCPERPAP